MFTYDVYFNSTKCPGYETPTKKLYLELRVISNTIDRIMNLICCYFKIS